MLPSAFFCNTLRMYEQHHESSKQPSHGIDLKVTVTTKGVWPEKDEMAALIIPPHMMERLEQCVRGRALPQQFFVTI